MARYLKQGKPPDEIAQEDAKIRQAVEGIIEDISTRGDDALRDYSERFDKWSPESFRLSAEETRGGNIPFRLRLDLLLPRHFPLIEGKPCGDGRCDGQSDESQNRAGDSTASAKVSPLLGIDDLAFRFAGQRG